MSNSVDLGVLNDRPDIAYDLCVSLQFLDYCTVSPSESQAISLLFDVRNALSASLPPVLTLQIIPQD